MPEAGPSSPIEHIDHVPTSDVEEQEVECKHMYSSYAIVQVTERYQVNEDGMVSCPICSKSTRSDRINDHLDSGCAAIYSSEGGTSKAADSKRAWIGFFQSGTNGGVAGKGKGKARATQRWVEFSLRIPF